MRETATSAKVMTHDSDTAPTAYRVDERIEEIMQTNRRKYDKSEKLQRELRDLYRQRGT